MTYRVHSNRQQPIHFYTKPNAKKDLTACTDIMSPNLNIAKTQDAYSQNKHTVETAFSGKQQQKLNINGISKMSV